MTTGTVTDFDQRYLETWTAPDAEQRRAAIEQLWAADGQLVISPLGITVLGVDAIAAHVNRVYEDNILGKGLSFVYDQTAEAGDSLLLRWSMLAPNGAVVGRGVDVVFRDAEGRATTIYMYMGIS